MAANSSGSCDSKLNFEKCSDRLKQLYPAVNEEETPLPRSWSPKDKYNYIGLSQNNLRVHYKGHGKTHKDAASVRATHPIPPSCGLYYFEVKIISKGRDGYMGIGLSGQTVNMNRLPGWDKHSYGYHGDDGHSFCSSGTGQPYGPTFTTGDVIGCGVNLIDNTAFYTKNGHNLGIAFTDLPPNLYPTVGLQTPGEVVDANFGQSPFVFDIEDMMNELKARIRNTIYNYPIPDTYGQWQSVLQKMVSTYLVHHGYCSTAEAFARGTGQAFDEEITSIKNRQRILKLVLNGKMGEAIETTSKIYPGLLEHNRNLLFMLKCRQFVEMVNGTDTEVLPPKCVPPASRNLSSPSSSPPQQQHPVSPQPTSVIQSTKSLSVSSTTTTTTTNSGTIMTAANNGTNTVSNSENGDNKDNNVTSININSRSNRHSDIVEEMNATNTLLNGANGVESSKNGVCENDVEMISQPVGGSGTAAAVTAVTDSHADAESDNNTNISKTNSNSQQSPSQHHHYQIQSSNNSSNSNHHFHHPQNHHHVRQQQQQQHHYQANHHPSHHNHNHNASQQLSPSSASVITRSAVSNGVANGYQNGAFVYEDSVEDMDIDPPSTNSSSTNGNNVCDKKKAYGGGKPAVERVLEFGRELFLLSVQLRQELGKNETNKKMLQDAFSLLAYSNPWNSPVGWQLDPAQRESVCATLNSAILESSNLARRPPLEVAVAHTTELITLMSHSGLGSCAFTNFDDLLH